MAKPQKISVTLRLYPEEALSVLIYCHDNKFITDKQYMIKTDKAMSKMSVFQDE